MYGLGGGGVRGLWGFGGGPLILIQNIKGAIKIQLVLCIGVGEAPTTYFNNRSGSEKYFNE